MQVCCRLPCIKGGASRADISSMRLVACPSCHAQYDVTEIAEKWLDCRCGEQIENRPLPGVEAQVRRCASCGAIVSSDEEHCGYCRSEILRDDTRDLSLICPECYGRNAEESRFCVGCGIAFRPERYVVEGLEFPCPCCGCLMPARSLAGIGINECPECNGLWVPEERFDTLVSKVIEAQQSADPAKIAELSSGVKRGSPTQQERMYRKCPVCEAHMTRANFWRTSLPGGPGLQSQGLHGAE